MAQAKRLVVHRRWGTDFPIITRAEGIYLYDTQGKRYIDGASGSKSRPSSAA